MAEKITHNRGVEVVVRSDGGEVYHPLVIHCRDNQPFRIERVPEPLDEDTPVITNNLSSALCIAANYISQRYRTPTADEVTKTLTALVDSINRDESRRETVSWREFDRAREIVARLRGAGVVA